MATDNVIDPLDGYCSKEARSPDEQAEEELRVLHRMNEEEIDPNLVRDVLKSDQLLAAMQDDKVLGRLVTYVTFRMDEVQKAWSACKDPRSDEAIQLHTDARACRLLIDWIQYVLGSGETAATQLEAEETHERED